jgi:threonine/homoserine/homoserine lactone efflux protein
MNLILYRNCFLVGLTAATAVGPIFVLVFNRGALYGFKKGFATALGAAIGDGTLFGLSFIGILKFLEQSHRIVIGMDLVVSLVLIILGVRMVTNQPKEISDKLECKEPILITAAKSFLLTVINPITIFFFMFISVKVIPENMLTITRLDSLLASAMISMGSLTTFSTVAFVARSLRQTVKPEQLRVAAHITGLAFILLGMYFSFDLIRQIAKFFEWL